MMNINKNNMDAGTSTLIILIIKIQQVFLILGENCDPDAIFVYALIKFQEAKTEKEREHSYRLIADAAYKGSEKAQKFLEELTM